MTEKRGSLLKIIACILGVAIGAACIFFLGYYYSQAQSHQVVQPKMEAPRTTPPPPPQTVADKYNITKKTVHAAYLDFVECGMIVHGNAYDDLYILNRRQFLDFNVTDQQMICRTLFCENAFQTGEEPDFVLFCDDRKGDPLARYYRDRGFVLAPSAR